MNEQFGMGDGVVDMRTQYLRSIGLDVPQDASASQWIGPELTGPRGAVSRTVPNRFESYVRVFHPAATSEGAPLKWEEVAKGLGRKMHPVVQWHTLVGLKSPDELPGSEWPGSPEVGAAPAEILQCMCNVLAEYTKCPEECFFGLWLGGVDKVTTASAMHSGVAIEDGEFEVWSPEEFGWPRFSLPSDAGRDYLLMKGPLRATTPLAESDRLPWESPNFIWPVDQAWFLATDIDYDSTLIGGSQDLISEIIAAEELEAWQISLDDSLAADADEINLS